MSEARWRAFVGEGTRTGKLAIVRPNGLPHVTPVWFLLDDSSGSDELVFTTWSASVKGRALAANPAFSLCVDEERPPYSFVMFEAEVHHLDEDPEQLRAWATRLGERYMGAERAAEYGDRNAVAGEFLVRATIRRVLAFEGIAD